MRSNEPCTSEEAEDCRVLARRQPDDSTDVYGECRDNEQTKNFVCESVGMANCVPNCHQPCTSEEAESYRVLAPRIIAYNPIPALT